MPMSSARSLRAANYTLFGNANDAIQSLGSGSLERYDARKRRVVALGGKLLPLGAFIADILQQYAGG